MANTSGPWDQYKSPSTESTDSKSGPWAAYGGAEAPAEPSLLRSIGDSAIALGSGITQGVGMLANVAGADNPVSRGLDSATKALADLESPYRKAEKQARAQKIAEAEKSGSLLNEVGAYAGSFAEAPIDTTLNALGTSLPTLAAGLLPGGQAALAARAAQLGLGAAQGVGAVKGQIYDEVEKAWKDNGATPENAAARAAQAQSYTGDNAGMILAGGALGAAAGSTGAEGAVRRLVGREVAKDAAESSILKSAGMGALKESPMEMLQGGQERLASNIALQNEGFDQPTWQGVAGQAALEGLASAPMGAGFGALEVTARAPAQTAPDTPPAQPTVQPPVAGPTLALAGPDRGVIQVAGDGTARTPAYQAPGYVGDVTDVEPRAVNPVREQVAAAAEQGGALSSAALTAIDTGLSDAMQPAPEQAPPQISLEEADARDQAAYEQFFSGLDADPVVGRYFENDNDIPDFDAASNASEEDFLRALGATDEDIQDAIATSSQPPIPQSSAPGDAGAQAYESAGTREGAREGAASQVGQVDAGIQPPATVTPVPGVGGQLGNDRAGSAADPVSGPVGQPVPVSGAADAVSGVTEAGTARDAGRADSNLPLSAPTNLRDALARVRQQKQEATSAQAVAPQAAPAAIAATSVPAATGSPVEAAGVAAPESLPTTQGAPANGPQASQAQQASPQPTQAAAAPAAAAGLTDGAQTANTGAQAAPAPGPQAAAPAESREQRTQRVAAAGEAWTRMPTVEREAMAGRADGLNPMQRKNVPRAAWADLSSDIRRKLADVMGTSVNTAQGAINTEAPQATAPVGDEQQFAPETGTLGIPRAEMPQIPSQSHGGLVKHLNAQGIDHETTMVDASELKPTQAEYSPSKVEAAKSSDGDRAVIVSSDGHIIDGHHQALAAAEEGKPVKAIVLDAPVEQALEAVKNSPSAQRSSASDPDAKNEKPLREGRAQPSQSASSEQTPFAESPQEAGEATTIPIGQSAVSVPPPTPEAQPVAAKQPASEPKGAIQDFGQKIGGARKDVWSGFKDDLNTVGDDDIAAQPLAKVWPAPDYQKLIDAGMNAKSVAAVRALRDEVPAKPRAAWKVKRWAEQVKTLRGLANDVMDGKITVQDMERMGANKGAGLRGMMGRIELYELVGHGKSLEGVRFGLHHYTLYRGRENVDLWVVEKDSRASTFSNWPTEIATGDTKEQALAAFKEKYDSLDLQKAVRKASFDIFSERTSDGFFIGKKIGRNYAKLEGPFKTVKEAREYRQNNLPALETKLEKYKEIPRERADVNQPRVGVDMRNGQDVTPQMFSDVFGFRGVEFGNWVEQKRRQKDLNDAFDALMDMAAVLDIPTKAISLNGKLGLAFGARGSGGVNPAAAHYEPDSVVINLTKKEGAGSLGHEWWHALDNYFAKQRKVNRGSFMTTGTDVGLAARGKDYIYEGGIRQEMIDAFGAVVKAINLTAMKARASKLDGKRTKEYWTTGEEMSARAFESYLISKLQDQNASNDYLANVVSEKTWDAMAALGMENDGSYPYPTAAEIPAIRAGFDHFFQTVETREDDAGNVAMFSRVPEGLTAEQAVALFNAQNPETADARSVVRRLSDERLVATQQLVDGIKENWARAPQIIVARNMQDNQVPQRVRDYDAELKSQGANGEPRGFIYLGKVYLLSDQLSSPTQIAEVLFHEVLGHYGLRGAFGDGLKPILQQIGTMRRADVLAKAREYGMVRKGMSDAATWAAMTEKDRLSAAEEVLAEMAQTTPEIGFVQRAIAAIRTWLRANVPGFKNLKLTDVDIVQAYILPARSYVTRSNETAQQAIDRAMADAGFSRTAGDQTQTEAFKRWFKDSKVVDADGKPLVVYHGTRFDFSEFDGYEVTGWFSATPDLANERYAFGESDDAGPNVMPVYLSIKNPKVLDGDMDDSGSDGNPMFEQINNAEYVAELIRNGHDGIVVNEDGRRTYAAFRPGQIKSAIGNNGNFDPEDDRINFSRASMADLASKAREELNRTFTAPGKLSWWHKTVGTMYNLAERSPAFKRVFDAAQGFVDDVSYYATDSAEQAPRLLPKLETWRDIFKRPITAADNAAVAKPVFEGTLVWTRDEAGKPVRVDDLVAAAEKLTAEEKARRLLRQDKISAGMLRAWQGLPLEQYEKLVDSRYESQMLKAGIVWTPAELKSMFKLTDDQVALYKEFRAATDRSLDTMARSDMLRYGGKDVADLRDMVMDAADAQDAAQILRDHLQMLAKENPERAGELGQLSSGMLDRAAKVQELQEQGYAPLSRFGKYTVDVVDANGERQYFGLFETQREANIMAMKMRKGFGQDAVSQGTLSNEEFKLLAGITPESLELFGNMLGLDSTGDDAQDQAFQEYLRRTKTNRSAMRRLIHRQGIAGYSEDVGRVLASFIYSNARQTSAGLHMGELGEAVTAIPKQQGELKDAAVQLSEYVKNPQEEAQAIRGLLFAQYLGGSIASAVVNMSQPAAVTFPWLSQFGGAKQAAAELGRAAKNLANKGHRYEADLAAALKQAEEEGTVSPQEVHQLMAQARGSGSLRPGDGTRTGDALASASNALTRLSLAWGKVFGAAEQVNRRMTYIAAFRIAKAQKMANPAAFAKKAVIETQFTYSKANKMKWGRGAVGATVMTFKTYSVAYLELLGRMWSQGGPEGKKAVLLALGMLMLMGGAGGLPFAEDAEDLVDGLAQLAGYNFNSKKAKQELLESVFGQAGAGFVERGITGLPGMPLDVSGRLGMGNLLPGTGIFKEKTDYTRDVLEVVGPVGDLAKRAASGARSILAGDVGAGLLQIAPAAVRNAAKGADMAATGMYRDDKGYKVLDTSPAEAAMKAIGFQPASVAKVQESNFINQQAKNFYNMKAQEIRAKWARGIFEKDQGIVAEARADLEEWNRKNPEQRIVVSMPAVLKRVREMSKTKDQRIADTAPRAMRQQMREETEKARATL